MTDASALSDLHETIRDVIAGITVATLIGIVPLGWKLLKRLSWIDKHEEQLNHEKNGLVVRVPELEEAKALHDQRIQRAEDDVRQLMFGNTPPHGYRPKGDGG